MYHRRDAVSIIATRSNQKPTKEAMRSVPNIGLAEKSGKIAGNTNGPAHAPTAGMRIHRDDRLYPGPRDSGSLR
jgi:hypothetical protein